MPSKDLWNRLSTEAQDFVPPSKILKEYADSLTEATNGLLVGWVDSLGKVDMMTHTFVVRVPALNNYTFAVLRIRHPLTGYPVSLYPELAAAQPAFAGSEEELRANLEDALREPKVQSAMSALLAQAATIS